MLTEMGAGLCVLDDAGFFADCSLVAGEKPVQNPAGFSQSTAPQPQPALPFGGRSVGPACRAGAGCLPPGDNQALPFERSQDPVKAARVYLQAEVGEPDQKIVAVGLPLLKEQEKAGSQEIPR